MSFISGQDHPLFNTVRRKLQKIKTHTTGGFHTSCISYGVSRNLTGISWTISARNEILTPLIDFPKSKIMDPWIYPITALTSFGSLRKKFLLLNYKIIKSKQAWILNCADRPTSLLDADKQRFSVKRLSKLEHVLIKSIP